jgi:hypothetical protein
MFEISLSQVSSLSVWFTLQLLKFRQIQRPSSNERGRRKSQANNEVPGNVVPDRPATMEIRDLAKAGGAFGLQMVSSATVHGLNLPQLSRAMGDVGIQWPDAFVNTMAIKKWLLSAALDVTDEYLRGSQASEATQSW